MRNDAILKSLCYTVIAPEHKVLVVLVVSVCVVVFEYVSKV